jgi:hypothetical protein
MSRRYKPGSFDFAAIHVIPLEVWFIIPATMINLGILLTPGKPNSKYYAYEEAWNLLKSPELQLEQSSASSSLTPTLSSRAKSRDLLSAGVNSHSSSGRHAPTAGLSTPVTRNPCADGTVGDN